MVHFFKCEFADAPLIEYEFHHLAVQAGVEVVHTLVQVGVVRVSDIDDLVAVTEPLLILDRGDGVTEHGSRQHLVVRGQEQDGFHGIR